MTPQRKFPGKASSMLVGIAVIAENAIRYQEKLSKKDATLTVDYLTDYRARIQKVSKDVLGADNGTGQRNAADIVTSATISAGEAFGDIKFIIDSKYRKDPTRHDHIMSQLGFKRFYDSAVSQDQHEDMGQFLEQFTTNLSEALEQELTGKGVHQDAITALRTFAVDYNNQNITHKGEMSVHKTLTSIDIEQLNAIYEEGIHLGKTGQRAYIGQDAVRDGFVFSKVAPGGGHDKEPPTVTTGVAGS